MNPADHEDWIPQLLDGNEQAVVEFWGRYGERLRRVADTRISAALRQRVDADDIVQSVCRTFFRRAQSGHLELRDADGLWGLLCVITLNKVRQHARYHSRKRRALDRQHSLSQHDGDPVWEPAGIEPTAEEAAIFVEQLEQLLSDLDREEQSIVDLKLRSFTNDEVAERLGCSERTVRRMIKRVQNRMRSMLGPGTGNG